MKLYYLFEDKIYIDCENINIEANKNAVSISLTTEDGDRISCVRICEFIFDIILSKQKGINKIGKGSFLFYLWHDFQSLRLRYSTVTKRKNNILPFGYKIKVVDDPSIIVSNFLEGAIQGLPKLVDFIDVSDDKDLDFTTPDGYELLVYMKGL